MGAVKNALQRDGLDPSIMDLDPERSVVSQVREEAKAVDEEPTLKEDPTYRCAITFRFASFHTTAYSNVSMISQQILQNVENGKNVAILI